MPCPCPIALSQGTGALLRSCGWIAGSWAQQGPLILPGLELALLVEGVGSARGRKVRKAHLQQRRGNPFHGQGSLLLCIRTWPKETQGHGYPGDSSSVCGHDPRKNKAKGIEERVQDAAEHQEAELSPQQGGAQEKGTRAAWPAQLHAALR